MIQPAPFDFKSKHGDQHDQLVKTVIFDQIRQPIDMATEDRLAEPLAKAGYGVGCRKKHQESEFYGSTA